jgi:hypothetical protein
MAMDFPSAPTLGQIFTDPVSNVTYTFNGDGWASDPPIATLPPPVDAYTKAESDAQHAQQTLDFVNVTGDTMTGPLQVNSNIGVSGSVNANSVVVSGADMQCVGYLNVLVDATGSARTVFSDASGTPGGVLYNFAGGTISLRAQNTDTIFYPNGNMFIVGDNAQKLNAGGWVGGSDARSKTVVGDYTQGLDAIKQINPRRYTFKDNTKMTEDGQSSYALVQGKEYIGLIAQQAEVAMPELVSQTTAYIDGAQVNDYRLLDITSLTYALINAVKELSAEIERLKVHTGLPELTPQAAKKK